MEARDLNSFDLCSDCSYACCTSVRVGSLCRRSRFFEEARLALICVVDGGSSMFSLVSLRKLSLAGAGLRMVSLTGEPRRGLMSLIWVKTDLAALICDWRDACISSYLALMRSGDWAFAV